MLNFCRFSFLIFTNGSRLERIFLMRLKTLVFLPLLACMSQPIINDAPGLTKEDATKPEVAKEAPANDKAQPHASTTMSLQGDLSFISVKNGDTPVAGSILGFKGVAEVSPEINGEMALKGTIKIPLSSLSTELELRDQRIQETFFDVNANPEALFHLKRMSHPKPGTAGMWIDGTLEIGPFKQEVRGHFRATQGEDGVQQLESGEAMIVSIRALGMNERLAKLITLCGHESVGDSIEVRASGTIKFLSPGHKRHNAGQ